MSRGLKKKIVLKNSTPRWDSIHGKSKVFLPQDCWTVFYFVYFEAKKSISKSITHIHIMLHHYENGKIFKKLAGNRFFISYSSSNHNNFVGLVDLSETPIPFGLKLVCCVTCLFLR